MMTIYDLSTLAEPTCGNYHNLGELNLSISLIEVRYRQVVGFESNFSGLCDLLLFTLFFVRFLTILTDFDCSLSN